MTDSALSLPLGPRDRPSGSLVEPEWPTSRRSSDWLLVP